MEERKKILYIITKSIWGGATKYTYDLAINLSRLPTGQAGNQFEVFVAAGGKDTLYKKLENTGVKYREIKHFQKSINPLKDVFVFFEILKLIRTLKPNIVHVSSSKAGGLVGLAVFTLRKLRITSYELCAVFTAHGWAYHEDRPSWQKTIIKIISRLTASFYNKIITVSEYDRLSAIKNNIAKQEKLTTVHNGIAAGSIDFLQKEEARQALLTNISRGASSGNQAVDNSLPEEAPREEFWMGSIGEFVKNKGHKFLIEAALELVKKYPAMKFVIVGHHGEEKNNLELRIKNYKLRDSVFLVDSQENAARYMKAFDIFILPSLKEGLPYVLLEAGLAKLPVIATAVGGNPEIIDSGKSGFLIDDEDPDDIVDGVIRLVENRALSDGFRESLHKKILQDFSFQKMLSGTIDVYEAI